MRRRQPPRFGFLHAALFAWFAGFCLSGPVIAAEPHDIETGLVIAAPGAPSSAIIEEAMAFLNIPAVSVALIDEDRIAWARAYGQEATPDTPFQAASLSKLVAAVGVLRLVDEKRLALDEDVNAKLTSWKVPANDFDRDHPVTLRGLLSMTGGVGAPGFIGYELGAPLPSSCRFSTARRPPTRRPSRSWRCQGRDISTQAAAMRSSRP